MVERLKAAIEKARQQRLGADVAQVAPPVGRQRGAAQDEIWHDLQTLKVDEAMLERERIVSYARADLSHVAFDVLRTRIQQTCATKGWRRIGVTSPTKGCGKSVITLNLAFSLSRQAHCRLAVLDLDLRAPRLARFLNVREKRVITQMLSGATEPAAHFQRIGETMAVAVNTRSERDSAELLSSPSSAAALKAIETTLRPDLMLIDMPPLLVGDDAAALMPRLDAVILVVGSGQTDSAEVEEAQRLITDSTAMFGVVLNRYSDAADSYYAPTEETADAD